MKHSIARLAASPRKLARALALAGFASLATFGFADTAEAQRSQAGEVWQSTAQRGQRRAPVTTRRDTRIPRNYRASGRYETRYERVWHEGERRQVWVSPVYQWQYDSCGRRVRVLVQNGYYRTERTPGHWDRKAVRVWVPARRSRVTETCPPPVRRQSRVTYTGGRYRG